MNNGAVTMRFPCGVRWALAALLIATGICATPRAHAAEAQLALSEARGAQSALLGDRVRAIPELMIALLASIENIAKYPALTHFPKVHQVAREELEREACGGQRCRFVRAAYLPEKGLYLDSALDPQGSLADRSILLHELVHHLQAATQRYAHLPPCERRRAEEREAFGIQNAYLAGFGAQPIAFPERAYRCDSHG